MCVCVCVFACVYAMNVQHVEQAYAALNQVLVSMAGIVLYMAASAIPVVRPSSGTDTVNTR